MDTFPETGDQAHNSMPPHAAASLQASIKLCHGNLFTDDVNMLCSPCIPAGAQRKRHDMQGHDPL
ncbi:hypothetical protein [Actinoallomurus vinaceus]|uniref:hypothetical protein n=1 Tax=Actinoallomurus vinaceus TaxID=1080074 RepID=UPI0031E95ADE